MSDFNTLKANAIQLLEKNGHKIHDWKDWNEWNERRYIDSFTRSFGNCIYCKSEVVINLYPDKNAPQMQGEVFTSECMSKHMTKDDEGIAVITYERCWKCDKKISPRNKKEVLRGVHNKCSTDHYLGTVVLNVKNNQIKVSALVPKPK